MQVELPTVVVQVAVARVDLELTDTVEITLALKEVLVLQLRQHGEQQHLLVKM
jgi:hypothetical protein